MVFLFKGIIIGFAIAAPVGPIGLLCIRRTLLFGRWSGLFTGLGAAVADTIYGLIAALGLTLISDLMFAYETPLKIFGGCFLIYIGYKTFFSQTAKKPAVISHITLLRDFASTLFLTLTNPMTIISYLAIFAGLGLAKEHGDYTHTELLVLGVFLGSMLWWLILSEGIIFFKKHLSATITLWINRIAGCLIAFFGLLVFISLFV